MKNHIPFSGNIEIELVENAIIGPGRIGERGIDKVNFLIHALCTYLHT